VEGHWTDLALPFNANSANQLNTPLTCGGNPVSGVIPEWKKWEQCAGIPISSSRIGPRHTPHPSEVANHVSQFDPKGFGNSQEGVNRNGAVGSLDLANVNRVQVGPLGQSLLRHPAFLAEPADVGTDSFVSLKAGHQALREQV
jgi:hypothetical protein